MQKQEQILIVDPVKELHFQGPLNGTMTSYLEITNPSHRRVAFKIRTTVHKNLIAKPKSGIIEAQQMMKVAIIISHLTTSRPKKAWKLMVRSVFVSGEENESNVWENADPESYMDVKLFLVIDSLFKMLPPTDGIAESQLG